MKKFLLSILLVTLFAAPGLAAERCDNCRMKVPDGSRNKVTVAAKDGGTKAVCSLYCASMEVERDGLDKASLTAGDFNTGETIPAASAFWVEGSDAPSVMSDLSRVAFKEKAEAEEFVKLHGGRLVTFDDAYAASVREWKK